MSLLLNNHPPNFIAKQFNRFFHLNNAMPVITQLNKDVYHQLHQTLLHQLTRREKKLNTMMQNPVENPFVLQPKIWNK
jgi:secreted Zn-dependent insulinase-like peptidase